VSIVQQAGFGVISSFAVIRPSSSKCGSRPLRVGDDAYGVQIAREIERISGRKVLLGAAYAALDRLERNELVASTVGNPTAERGGRAKRFFRVTPRGLRAVKETRQALVALWQDLPQLKEKRT
jgi:DNA-binding PadR family transcriptional regulator